MSVTAYRLSIAPALEPFRAEIEHVCLFLEDCYALMRSPDAARVLHYGDSPPANAISVSAHLFPDAVSVRPGGLFPVHDRLARIVNELTPSDGGGTAFCYDAIGLIFLLLSRLEEREHPQRDRYQRFPLNAALFQPQNGRLYPLADRAAHDLASAITGDLHPERRTSYSVLFTHDVDILRGYHRLLEPLRHAAGDLLKRGNPASALRRLARGYFSHEPWRSARQLMDLSERNGIVSRFYFMGPSDHPMDSPYVMTMAPLLREVAAEVRKRGHVVGFHPGFYTATDKSEWNRQRRGLESAIGMPVDEGRQHVLRYDAAMTPRVWSDADMTLDCTLAYPECVGFRAGTCRPHRAFDLVTRETLPLRQVSTAVMEFGLFGGKYRHMSVDDALADTKWATDVCRQYEGMFTLLFHSGQTDRDLWAWLRPAIEQAAA